MECKNCNLPLRSDYTYCSNCGAKIIRNRLSFKNLWFDITERYFNLDNTFLKTFWHLFTNPSEVIQGYINGVRRKYLNPVSYLAIALTLSGILIFLLRKVFDGKIDWGSIAEGNAEFALKWKEMTFDYSSLFFLMYIPILAIAAFISFNKVKFNLSEHFVVLIYVLAQYSIFSFPISLIILITTPDNYLSIGMPFMLFILLYSIYVLQKINRYKLSGVFARGLLYSLLSAVGLFIFIIAFMIILFVTGVFNLEDFAPPK